MTKEEQLKSAENGLLNYLNKHKIYLGCDDCQKNILRGFYYTHKYNSKRNATWGDIVNHCQKYFGEFIHYAHKLNNYTGHESIRTICWQ